MFTVTKTKNSTAADTAEITVIVPARLVFSCPVKTISARIGVANQVPLNYNGTAPVTYTSSSPAICEVDPVTGELTPLKAGLAIITIRVEGLTPILVTVNVMK